MFSKEKIIFIKVLLLLLLAIMLILLHIDPHKMRHVSANRPFLSHTSHLQFVRANCER